MRLAVTPTPRHDVTEVREEVVAWLCGPDGLDAVSLATAELDGGGDPLGVGSRLRAAGLDASRATVVMGAAQARRRARGVWPHADELLLTPEGLEQASAPAVAAWRARRLAGEAVWDLCAGLGGDAMAMATLGARVTAVDVDGARLRLLGHNASVLGLEVETRVGDALLVDIPRDTLVHADPSRRRDGRRVRWLADHRPPVGDLLARHRTAPGMAVVLSPAVDLDDADLPGDAELEFLEDAEGLRESVAWLGTLRRGGVVASATLLPGGEHRERRGPPASCDVGPLGSHLVEVRAAAVRARLHPEIAGEIGARRVARRRELLTTDDDPPASPWYRARRIVTVLPARPKALRRWLRQADEQPIEFAVHGLDADPVAWWRAVGRPPRGPQGRMVHLVRTDDGARAVVTDVRPTHSGGLWS